MNIASLYLIFPADSSSCFWLLNSVFQEPKWFFRRYQFDEWRNLKGGSENVSPLSFSLRCAVAVEVRSHLCIECFYLTEERSNVPRDQEHTDVKMFGLC